MLRQSSSSGARPARLHRFAMVSGAGWLLDLFIMTSLTVLGTSVFAANCFSAATAVSFVFLIAQRHTFSHDGSWIAGKFAVYALYNVGAILLASVAISTLAHHVFEPMLPIVFPADLVAEKARVLLTIASLAAKVMVTPLTLYANFVFMGWLLERRASFR